MKKIFIVLIIILILSGCSQRTESNHYESNLNLATSSKEVKENLSEAEEFCIFKSGKIEIYEREGENIEVCFINNGIDGIRCKIDLFFQGKCGMNLNNNDENIFSNKYFSFVLPGLFIEQNNTIKPKNKNDFSQIIYQINSQNNIMDYNNLIEWENNYLKNMCKETDSCGVINSIEKIEINNIKGIKFFIQYKGRSIDNQEGFINEYYYTFLNNNNYFRIWTSATDLENPEKTKNIFEKIINSIKFK